MTPPVAGDAGFDAQAQDVGILDVSPDAPPGSVDLESVVDGGVAADPG
jgi:hypothetical protein